MATFLHRAVLNREKETVEEDRASRQEISSNIPDSVEATDVVTGEKVALSSLIPGDRTVLLWFWAIW